MLSAYAWVFYFACSMIAGNAKASRRGTSREFGTTLFLCTRPNLVSVGQLNNMENLKPIDQCGIKALIKERVANPEKYIDQKGS